jgi:hypothetical protein
MSIPISPGRTRLRPARVGYEARRHRDIDKDEVTLASSKEELRIRKRLVQTAAFVS